MPGKGVNLIVGSRNTISLAIAIGCLCPQIDKAVVILEEQNPMQNISKVLPVYVQFVALLQLTPCIVGADNLVDC